MSLKISFEGSDQRLIAFLKSRMQTVTAAVVARLNALMIGLQAHIVGDKLSGQVLHHRTGHLIDSTRLEPPTPEIVGPSVIGGVQSGGPIAVYARVHEYGLTVSVPEHVRRTLRGGEATVRAYTASYPERSFMRTGLDDMRQTIISGLQGAVHEALSK